MSVKVAGIWELSWNSPLVESWLWSFPLREYQVSEWAMSPVTGITHIDSWDTGGVQFKEYENVEDMVNNFPGDHVRVFVDEAGSTPLAEFVHPQNAVYFFGKAGSSPIIYKRSEDLAVRLVTKINKGTLWPHQCLVAILNDRLLKNVDQG